MHNGCYGCRHLPDLREVPSLASDLARLDGWGLARAAGIPLLRAPSQDGSQSQRRRFFLILRGRLRPRSKEHSHEDATEKVSG